MSRSYRRVGCGSDVSHGKKKIASRRFRRINKVRVQQEKEPLLVDEVTNPYDIIDFKYLDFNRSTTDYPRCFRK